MNINMASNIFALGLLLSTLAVLFPASTEKSIKPTTTMPTTTKERVGVCFQPKAAGVCMGYFPRFYFNQKKKKCEEFVYGGCGGNQNNFMTEAACKYKCATAVPQVFVAIIPVKKTPPPTTQKPNKKPCEIEKNKALASNQSGVFVPECNKKGYYKPKQCWKPLGLPHRCWCVNKQGSKIGEVKKLANGKETCNKHKKTKREWSQCLNLLKNYHKLFSKDDLAKMYVPQCDDYTGLFAALQCYQDDCWCVDTFTGTEVKNSNGKKNTVKCTYA